MKIGVLFHSLLNHFHENGFWSGARPHSSSHLPYVWRDAGHARALKILQKHRDATQPSRLGGTPEFSGSRRVQDYLLMPRTISSKVMVIVDVPSLAPVGDM